MIHPTLQSRGNADMAVVLLTGADRRELDMAFVFDVLTTKAVLGAIVTRIPTVVEASPAPLDVIRTGDLLRVDGDRGEISVRKSRSA